MSFQMSIASYYLFDVFLAQWDFARTILRLWFVPVVEHLFMKNFCLIPMKHLHTINYFASKCTKTRLMIYDRTFFDVYVENAIRGCKYDRVYFDVFYLHLWTDISQRELKMGPCHQYIHSHWRALTDRSGKNIQCQDWILFFETFFIILYHILTT